MLIKNVSYKGVSLSDDVAKTTHIVLQKEVHDVKLRTTTTNKESYHGAYSSHTLAEGRLFTFSGYVFGATKADRYIGQKILEDMLVPEAYPSDTNRGYYELTWTDDGGNTQKCQAKVFSKPEYEHDLEMPMISFTFELYAEDPRVYGAVEKSASGTVGYYGGNKLPNKLPSKMNNLVNDFSMINVGNFPAPCRIEIVGSVTNPKIVIGSRWYQLNTTTTNLVFSNQSGKLSVTDNLVDVSGYRVPGSKNVFVDPGTNVIYVQPDSYVEDPAPVVTCYWYDTSI